MSKSLKIFLVVILFVATAAFVAWRQGWLAPLEKVGRQIVSGEPKPGVCLLVEEKYCSKAEFLYVEGVKDPILGFDIPAGAPVFAPIDGNLIPIFSENPDDVANPYRGVLLRHFVVPNSTIGLISVNIIANPLKNINPNSEVRKGDVLGYAPEAMTNISGGHNLIVSIENQALTSGTVYSNTNLYIEDRLAI
ncbi:MAG: hypothetical protein M1586_01185 [Patescibacteria group bacterium]|nr:hypothetical protein [Patescibacteria group bacterium]MCL5261900.1 hypothetical protein [Patescibacteria group bacterium]